MALTVSSWTTIIQRLLGSGWSFVRGFNTQPGPNQHFGIDIAASTGTSIPSFSSGTVVYAQNETTNEANAFHYWANGGGNTVEVLGANGVLYQYAHMSQINVKVGDTVSRGTVLGLVGSTGNATGPHLHFAMIKTVSSSLANNAGWSWIDPTTFLEALPNPSGGPILDGFLKTIGRSLNDPIRSQDIDPFITYLEQHTSLIPGDPVGQVIAGTGIKQALQKEVSANRTWAQVGQDLLGQAATQSDMGTQIAQTAGSLSSIAGTLTSLLDPTTYIHVGAFLLGLILAYQGLKIVTAPAPES